MDIHPEGLNFFHSLATSPQAQLAFAKDMEGLAAGKVDWTKIYDTNQLLDGYDLAGDGAFLVELGGSHDHDITRLLNRHLELPAGRLVLQDLPDVLQFVNVHEKIIVLPHDFFTPQPIQGRSLLTILVAASP